MDEIAHIVVIRDTLMRLVVNCMATPTGGLLLKIAHNAIQPAMILVMDSILPIRLILGAG
ncbi:unnamed protein product [Prunus armeniaca]